MEDNKDKSPSTKPMPPPKTGATTKDDGTKTVLQLGNEMGLSNAVMAGVVAWAGWDLEMLAELGGTKITNKTPLDMIKTAIVDVTGDASLFQKEGEAVRFELSKIGFKKKISESQFKKLVDEWLNHPMGIKRREVAKV